MNAINCYTCPECGGRTVTIDVDDGTTPFLLRCKATPGCEGMAESGLYRPPPDCGPPQWEWYKPGPEETRRLPRPMREHVQQGGLLLRAHQAARNFTNT